MITFRLRSALAVTGLFLIGIVQSEQFLKHTKLFLGSVYTNFKTGHDRLANFGHKGLAVWGEPTHWPPDMIGKASLVGSLPKTEIVSDTAYDVKRNKAAVLIASRMNGELLHSGGLGADGEYLFCRLIDREKIESPNLLLQRMVTHFSLFGDSVRSDRKVYSSWIHPNIGLNILGYRLPDILSGNLNADDRLFSVPTKIAIGSDINREPGTLRDLESFPIQINRILHGAKLKEINESDNKRESSPQSRDLVKTLSNPKLLVPVVLLVGLPLFIFGGWMNAYGIDRANSVLADLGWISMFLGGIPMAWFITVLISHVLN